MLLELFVFPIFNLVNNIKSWIPLLRFTNGRALQLPPKMIMTKKIPFKCSRSITAACTLVFFQISLLSHASIFLDTTSYIHTVDIYTGKIDTIVAIKKHFEAPNWHPDNYLILNSMGKLYTLDVSTKKIKELNTGFANQCNNDHGISPDGKSLVISHNDKSDPSTKSYKSAIYILPVTGGEPKRITPEVPSFWHGWSPDGRTLAYCAERDGNFDIYTIDVNGGTEKRLTNTKDLDDGPDYSPDGKYIYFNSYRTGHMQIWRINADGSNPKQLTFDENSNWFPHPSPDNKWIFVIAIGLGNEPIICRIIDRGV